MLRDRDYLIFFALLLGVVLLNVIPFPPPIKTTLFVIIVIFQALFIYNGLKRGR